MLKERAWGDESWGFSRSVEECTCCLEKPDNKAAPCYLGPPTLEQVNSSRGNNQLKLTCKFSQLSKIQLGSQDPATTDTGGLRPQEGAVSSGWPAGFIKWNTRCPLNWLWISDKQVIFFFSINRSQILHGIYLIWKFIFCEKFFKDILMLKSYLLFIWNMNLTRHSVYYLATSSSWSQILGFKYSPLAHEVWNYLFPWRGWACSGCEVEIRPGIPDDERLVGMHLRKPTWGNSSIGRQRTPASQLVLLHPQKAPQAFSASQQASSSGPHK